MLVRNVSFAVLALILFVTFVVCPATKAIEAEQQQPSLSLTDVPVRVAIQAVCKAFGISYVIDPNVESHKVSLKCKTDSLEQALRELCDVCKVKCVLKDDVYQFSASLGPGSFESEAPAATQGLEATTNDGVLDLANQKKIEVEASGKDIQTMNLKLRRLVPESLFVVIPSGTYFKPREGNVQPMIATAGTHVVLRDDNPVIVSVRVACADRTKFIPRDLNAFDIERSPKNQDLQRLVLSMPENIDFAIIQAAVWILANDADFNELGTLTARYSPMVEALRRLPEGMHWADTRTITENRTVEALRLIDKAGIEITNKKIWQDRRLISSGLKDGELKSWLDRKDQSSRPAAVQSAAPNASNMPDSDTAKDVLDLIEQKKIEVDVVGQSIQTLNLNIRRLSKENIAVSIPLGTLFKPLQASVQPMISTAAQSVILDTDDWESVQVSVACADVRQEIPNRSNRFRVRRSTQNRDFQSILETMQKHLLPFQVTQATVWILTNNASYDQLGRLSGGSRILGHNVIPKFSRTITEEETVEAMKLFEEAGIDITKKKIWHDRKRILSGLKDGDLKNWLDKKMGNTTE